MDWKKLPIIRNDNLIFEDTITLPTPGAIVPCLLCTKPFVMPLYHGEPDQICPECFKVYNEAAKVICIKCKVTICRLVPKLLDNGFYIRPRSVLHADKCNVCCPGLTESRIIEIDEWERTKRDPKIIVIRP